jgi:ubiquinone/menaquinone biosynthesis C-methylase UbiE
MKKKADYGNWVPQGMLLVSGAVAAVFFVLGLVVRPAGLRVGLLVVAAFPFLFLLYLVVVYVEFARDNSRIPRRFYRLVIDRLPWDGDGTALDIGTGNGAVAIELAKRLPEARVVGVDLWGKPWNYGRDVCDSNAAAEGVGDRVRFERASAIDLPFGDETFDAVVTNFVFHTIDVSDRLSLVREALRVLKPGGAFSLQDLFNDQFYRNPETLADEVRSWGLEDVQFVSSLDLIDVPALLKTKHMVGGSGVLYGRKVACSLQSGASAAAGRNESFPFQGERVRHLP